MTNYVNHFCTVSDLLNKNFSLVQRFLDGHLRTAIMSADEKAPKTKITEIWSKTSRSTRSVAVTQTSSSREIRFTVFNLKIAASRTVKLGGTVATVGFPDIGLQGFAPKAGQGGNRVAGGRGG
jgi:hypothetical protein